MCGSMLTRDPPNANRVVKEGVMRNVKVDSDPNAKLSIMKLDAISESVWVRLCCEQSAGGNASVCPTQIPFKATF